MIEHQKEYEIFLQKRGVGAKDKVADSIKSYVSYLNGICRNLNVSISPRSLNSESDIGDISRKLVGKVAQSTIQNYKVAMKHYVEMVRNEGIKQLDEYNVADEVMVNPAAVIQDDIYGLWLKYNEYSNKLANALGRTSNIVGEYAKFLAHKHYGGSLLEISGSSADIETADGRLYQVKSRKIKRTASTQLNVIRSWDFDFLVVILFDENGKVMQALEVPVEVAREYGKSNSHQNGWVITTSHRFLTDNRSKDISCSLSELNK